MAFNRQWAASIVLIVTLCANGDKADAPVPSELIVVPGEPVAATIEGAPARLQVLSGGPDRLLLDAGYVAQHGIEPAPIAGNANLSLAGRREFRGKNRPLDFTIAGMPQAGRAFWFKDVPVGDADGWIGPWAMPQSRVTFRFGTPSDTEKRFDMPLLGNINSSSITGYLEASFGMLVGFDLDDREPYPMASAAAGAAIAKAYGGQLSGASWDVEILFGVKRPVRLMTLARPLVIGPLSFDRIAVRVRDRIDAAGRGNEIPDGTEDPSEIVVSAKQKVPKPYYTFAIPRASLAACSRLTFDKVAKRVELWCKAN